MRKTVLYLILVGLLITVIVVFFPVLRESEASTYRCIQAVWTVDDGSIKGEGPVRQPLPPGPVYLWSVTYRPKPIPIGPSPIPPTLPPSLILQTEGDSHDPRPIPEPTLRPWPPPLALQVMDPPNNVIPYPVDPTQASPWLPIVWDCVPEPLPPIDIRGPDGRPIGFWC